MIAPDVPGMKAELMNAVFFETDPERRVRFVHDWFLKWLKELHVAHTFSRDILHHYKDDKGFIEHAHRQMSFKMGDALLKSKYCVLEIDYTPEFEKPDHFRREDRLSVYILGRP